MILPKANSPREMSPFLIPDRDAMPLILRDSQSPATDTSRESDLKRRRGNNQTFKTSEADLSADMFFGNTENFDHTQGFVISFQYLCNFLRDLRVSLVANSCQEVLFIFAAKRKSLLTRENIMDISYPRIFWTAFDSNEACGY